MVLLLNRITISMKFKWLYVTLLFASIVSCKNSIEEKDGMTLIKGSGIISDFYIDQTPVTVGQWREFVTATKYVSQAESFGDAGVFNFETGEWSLLKGANWHHPFGPDSSAAPNNHPVTQVSWNDCQAYAKWAKKRLPTTAEYELAAKGGDKKYAKDYAWGEGTQAAGKYKTNYWQGNFPHKNLILDGFLTTNPVGHFGRNEYKLADMGGNVWNWCQDNSTEEPGEKEQRGGSFLCDPTVCHGFKIGSTSSSTAETSLCHLGFRCVRDR
jgi:formylglycine-generating enzyme